MQIIKQVEHQINSYLIDKEYKSILLLISGGIDSIVLFSILIKILKEKDFKLFLLHCNYGTTSNSKLAENLCRKIAFEKNVKIFIKNVQLPKKNFEHNARVYRYNAAAEISKHNSVDLVFTAHHFEDQLETLYMKKYFNSDWISSIGIRESLGNIYRPMLNIEKKDINDYAAKNDLKWVHDPTNDDLKILRNKIRNSILPELKDNNENEIEKLFQKRDTSLKRYFNLKKNIFTNEKLFLVEKCENYLKIKNFIVDEINQDDLKLYYQIYSKKFLNVNIRASQSNWNNFYKFVKHNNTSKNFIFNEQISVLMEKEDHVFVKNGFLKENNVRIHPSFKKIKWFNTNIIDEQSLIDKSTVKYKFIINKKIIEDGLFVRNWKSGDKCFSKYYNSYIKLSNVFINNKITNFEKAQYPVVVNLDDEIISVPNLYNKTHYSLIRESDKKSIYWVSS